ncbi:serine protease 27-like [Xiphias gladius]|uniref:serine protease 27-like n=1 Tax=Xiphias gladius TaxID=8245 RepID=UPI001A99D540|nr:serine protease 27-like [Xiphias gladius]
MIGFLPTCRVPKSTPALEPGLVCPLPARCPGGEFSRHKFGEVWNTENTDCLDLKTVRATQLQEIKAPLRQQLPLCLRFWLLQRTRQFSCRDKIALKRARSSPEGAQVRPLHCKILMYPFASPVWILQTSFSNLECSFALEKNRIVGGQNASPGSWPWQATLISNNGPFCAGSLISSQWVLTAAHCLTEFERQTTTVYLGRHNQSGSNIHQVARKIAELTHHPSYDLLTNENDICLLKLSAPVSFTEYIRPVCLASAGSTFHTGTSSWVTGWGDTHANGKLADSDILQEVNMPVVGNNECKCYHTLPITENMLCAGLKAGGKDACQGDSGGALVTSDQILWVQGGIVSFGEGCARPKSPGVYTRVSQYQEWIQNITGSAAPGFVTFTSLGIDSDLNFTCRTSPPSTTTTTTTTTTVSTTSKGGDDKGGTVFDSGENTIHFSHFTHFISLSVLVLSLCVLVGDI